jgi:cytochrome b561
MKILSKILARLKHGILVTLFILVPFAGAFHSRLQKRENPDDKEIGAEK